MSPVLLSLAALPLEGATLLVPETTDVDAAVVDDGTDDELAVPFPPAGGGESI